MQSIQTLTRSSPRADNPILPPAASAAVEHPPSIDISVLFGVLNAAGIPALLIDQTFFCLAATRPAVNDCRLGGLFTLQGRRVIWRHPTLSIRRMVVQPEAAELEVARPDGDRGWRLKSQSLNYDETNPTTLVVIECLTDAQVGSSVDWAIQHLNLTRKEAELAVALANGASIRSYARATGVSIHTVRNQLKSIFAKMDVHSQKDLVTRVTQYHTPREPSVTSTV